MAAHSDALLLTVPNVRVSIIGQTIDMPVGRICRRDMSMNFSSFRAVSLSHVDGELLELTFEPAYDSGNWQVQFLERLTETIISCGSGRETIRGVSPIIVVAVGFGASGCCRRVEGELRKVGKDQI